MPSAISSTRIRSSCVRRPAPLAACSGASAATFCTRSSPLPSGPASATARYLPRVERVRRAAPNRCGSPTARHARSSWSAPRLPKEDRCSCCAMRPTSKRHAGRAMACWATSRTNSARRSRRNWPAVEMLRDGLDTLAPDQQRELLTNIERGVLRLMRLIDNLLESVRIESGQLAVRRQPVDLEATVDEAVELLRPLLAQASLRVTADLAALHGRSLLGDAQRLLQVFVNLLSNAVKFAPAASDILIGAQVRGDSADNLGGGRRPRSTGWRSARAVRAFPPRRQRRTRCAWPRDSACGSCARSSSGTRARFVSSAPAPRAHDLSLHYPWRAHALESRREDTGR